MARIENQITATVKAVLVYFDGPQLIQLESSRNNNMLAVAVHHPKSDNVFFGCETGEKQFDRYWGEKADLHYVFQNALRHQYYLFDYEDDSEREKVVLDPLPQNDPVTEKYLPKVGIFSRSHTSKLARNKLPLGQREYFIDGKWAATDFSRFYNKFADLYALFAVFGENWVDLSDGKKEEVSDIVKSKMFRGGGSYVGLYDQLMDQVISSSLSTLDVKEIKYASPGKLVLSGNPEVLSDVNDAIKLMSMSKDSLGASYRKIHGILSVEKLLGERPTKKFSTPDRQRFVKTQTDHFASEMGLSDTQALYEASGRKTIVYSKIVLSIYRRLKEVYLFHEEGRIQTKKSI